MNFEEKLVEAYQARSKLIAVLLITIIFISGYVISRALNVFFDEAYALQIVQGQEQGKAYGLKFSFLALSFFWPLIISLVCVIAAILISNQNILISQLGDSLSKSVKEILLLNPYNLTSDGFSDQKFLFHFLRFMPYFAIGIHALSLMYSFAIGGNFPPCHSSDQCDSNSIGYTEYIIFLVINLICILTSLLWIRKFPRAINDIV